MTLTTQVNNSTVKVGKGLSKTLGLLSAASVAALMATTITPSVATAQVDQSATYSGGKARVNKSGKLRALSEAVADASCRLAAGIETENAIAQMSMLQNDYNTILAGLETGSAAQGMPGAEKSSVVLKSIWALKENWAPMDAAATAMVNGNNGDAGVISSGRQALFDNAVILASDVSGQYSDPQELLQSDAITFNFIGRQSSLANTMSRATCELATNAGNAGARDELEQAVSLFDASLNALMQGFPNAGISPPPNDAVAGSLQKISEMWSANRDIFDAALGGATPNEADVVRAAQLVSELDVAINNTVTLYLIASPGQDGVYRVPLEAYSREVLTGWLTNPELIEAIKVQNAAHVGLTEAQVIALDQEWRAEAGNGGGPLISKLIGHPMSDWLLAQQTATAGFVTEVFVMDDKGLNVAQSAVTSDYWQGDEAKWKQTYLNGPGALHIGEVEFDDSTGYYQSQASMSISDPATGAVIGAITFGVNVQSLM